MPTRISSRRAKSAELDDEERTDKELTDPAEAEMNDRMARATAATSDASEAGQRALLEAELALVDEMRDIADASRYDPDARIKKIINWVDENMCPVRGRRTDEMPRWNERRVIIFTEYEDTRRYIERCLGEAIARSDQADARIATFTGVTSRQRREEIKHAFNTEPSTHALRILIATDAAREGLNLQRHCHDLYHFDLPWNPSRLDQRNGRIDRKLQPADEVFCRYFFYPRPSRGQGPAGAGAQGRADSARHGQRRPGPRRPRGEGDREGRYSARHAQ